MNTVEKWGLFEVSLKGPSAGNPFTEQSVSATFRSKNEIVTVDGFYDGDGVYKVRFMPSFTGDYVYETVGSFPEAESAGDFTVTEPTGNNHGPVRIANTYHFAYEDTTPYYSEDRKSILFRRHHVLRVGAPAGRSARANARGTR